MCREELGNHLESMQAELDNIRDVLRGDGYKIDANTLLGVNISAINNINRVAFFPYLSTYLLFNFTDNIRVRVYTKVSSIVRVSKSFKNAMYIFFV